MCSFNYPIKMLKRFLSTPMHTQHPPSMGILKTQIAFSGCITWGCPSFRCFLPVPNRNVQLHVAWHHCNCCHPWWVLWVLKPSNFPVFLFLRSQAPFISLQLEIQINFFCSHIFSTSHTTNAIIGIEEPGDFLSSANLQFCLQASSMLPQRHFNHAIPHKVNWIPSIIRST
jgi:hypothetical protein